jgi:2TM domain
MSTTSSPTDGELYERALTQLKRKAQFRNHAIWFTIVNLGHVAIWAATGATSVFFWPVFPAAIWGFFLALEARTTYGRNGRTPSGPAEEKIRREMDSLRASAIR